MCLGDARPCGGEARMPGSASSAPQSGDPVCELRPCAPRRTRAGLAPHGTPSLMRRCPRVGPREVRLACLAPTRVAQVTQISGVPLIQDSPLPQWLVWGFPRLNTSLEVHVRSGTSACGSAWKKRRAGRHPGFLRVPGLRLQPRSPFCVSVAGSSPLLV